MSGYRRGMATVLVTGSADGIGRQTAHDLVAGGHRVVLHARSDRRAREVLAAVPGAAGVVVGDLASLAQTRAMAASAAGHGPYDTVVHNAGISRAGADSRAVTGDGLEETFQVNVLAPYLLTALMPRPPRLVYLASGAHSAGVADLDDLQRERTAWDGMQAYRDSKLYDVVLAFAVARRWPDVFSNAVDPGWIRTRMGGPHADEDLPAGSDTPVWLATSDEPAARVTGRYFVRRAEQRAHPAAYDTAVQDGLLAACARLSGVELPAGGGV
jgi:NAD(P)-dependent dehydrogenase (short-subunit alcohol dehydrogenase family)